MPEFLQVQTTVDDEQAARRLARSVLDERRAACVQIIGPITSIYRWEGKREESGEWLLLMKTPIDAYESLERTILELHPYDVPEIIALPVLRGSGEYLRWVRSETTL
jgi:periplasmic divalent cation tolerance protein